LFLFLFFGLSREQPRVSHVTAQAHTPFSALSKHSSFAASPLKASLAASPRVSSPNARASSQVPTSLQAQGIPQLQHELQSVKEMVQSRAASNPLLLELNKVRNELQAQLQEREDEIVRLRALNADRNEAINAIAKTNDQRASLLGFDRRSVWSGAGGSGTRT
jgi:hypothetical protein